MNNKSYQSFLTSTDQIPNSATIGYSVKQHRTKYNRDKFLGASNRHRTKNKQHQQPFDASSIKSSPTKQTLPTSRRSKHRSNEVNNNNLSKIQASNNVNINNLSKILASIERRKHAECVCKHLGSPDYHEEKSTQNIFFPTATQETSAPLDSIAASGFVLGP